MNAITHTHRLKAITPNTAGIVAVYLDTDGKPYTSPVALLGMADVTAHHHREGRPTTTKPDGTAVVLVEIDRGEFCIADECDDFAGPAYPGDDLLTIDHHLTPEQIARRDAWAKREGIDRMPAGGEQ